MDQRPDGLVHHAWNAYNDGTIAVDMGPLSLLCRLATSVPPPWFHTVKYVGVLAPASRVRLITRGAIRPSAERLARTVAVDVLACPTCRGRMKQLVLVKGPASIARTLAAEVPQRSRGRVPPDWKNRVVRLKVLGDAEEGGGRRMAGKDVA